MLLLAIILVVHAWPDQEKHQPHQSAVIYTLSYYLKLGVFFLILGFFSNAFRMIARAAASLIAAINQQFWSIEPWLALQVFLSCVALFSIANYLYQVRQNNSPSRVTPLLLMFLSLALSLQPMPTLVSAPLLGCMRLLYEPDNHRNPVKPHHLWPLSWRSILLAIST